MTSKQVYDLVLQTVSRYILVLFEIPFFLFLFDCGNYLHPNETTWFCRLFFTSTFKFYLFTLFTKKLLLCVYLAFPFISLFLAHACLTPPLSFSCFVYGLLSFFFLLASFLINQVLDFFFLTSACVCCKNHSEMIKTNMVTSSQLGEFGFSSISIFLIGN